MGGDNNDLTTLQLQVLAIVPKIVSSFSIPCSIFIITEVVRDHRRSRQGRGRGRVISRALAGMSVVDVLASFGWFLSSWAVPRDVGSDEVYNVGNQQTCSFQGFLLQLAIGAPMYNASLSLWYLLIVKYEQTDDQLRTWEPWVHGVILTFSVGTSIALLPLGMYNHIRSVCWTMGSPQGCENSNYQPSPDIPCDRGNYAWLYGILLFYGPLWCCIVFTTAAMLVIYCKVRSTERRSDRYQRGGVATSAGAGRRRSRRRLLLRRGNHNNRHSRMSRTDTVAVQALLYAGAFYITWAPSTVWSITHWFDIPMFWLDLLQRLAEPSQGLLNFLVFLRPRKALQARLLAQLEELCGWICCCCCCGRDEGEDGDDELPTSALNATRGMSARTTTNHALSDREEAKEGPKPGCGQEEDEFTEEKTEEEDGVVVQHSENGTNGEKVQWTEQRQ